MSSGGVIKIEYDKWLFRIPPTISEDEYKTTKTVLKSNEKISIRPKTGHLFYQKIKLKLYLVIAGTISFCVGLYIEKEKMVGVFYSIVDILFVILFLIGLYNSISILTSLRSYMGFLIDSGKYYRVMKKDIIESKNYEMFREIFCPKYRARFLKDNGM